MVSPASTVTDLWQTSMNRDATVTPRVRGEVLICQGTGLLRHAPRMRGDAIHTGVYIEGC